MDFRRQMNDFFAHVSTGRMSCMTSGQNRIGMKPSTVAVLYLLDQFSETCTQGWNMRKYICCPSRQFTRWCRSWRQAGYLEKVSVSGRKEKPLRLTESGKRYTADKLCGLYRAEERAAAAMGAEQFAAMVEMTRKFTDSFEKEIRNGAE